MLLKLGSASAGAAIRLCDIAADAGVGMGTFENNTVMVQQIAGNTGR